MVTLWNMNFALFYTVGTYCIIQKYRKSVFFLEFFPKTEYFGEFSKYIWEVSYSFEMKRLEKQNSKSFNVCVWRRKQNNPLKCPPFSWYWRIRIWWANLSLSMFLTSRNYNYSTLLLHVIFLWCKSSLHWESFGDLGWWGAWPLQIACLVNGGNLQDNLPKLGEQSVTLEKREANWWP